MALKDILVSTDATSVGEARLRLAMDLARTSRGHLAAVYPYVEPRRLRSAAGVEFGAAAAPGVLTGGAAPEAAGIEDTREADRAEAAGRLFASEMRRNGITGEWHLLGEDDGEALIELAKAADLVVLGQLPREGRVDGAARFRPDSLLMEAGRPVLVIPYAGSFPAVGQRVLVAWDGTREAIRAMNDAMPLFSEGAEVTVLHVAAQQAALDRVRPALERAAGHLRRHGFAAKGEESLKGSIAVSDVLLSRAADLGADLIVAGGYHHSPLREAVLGGVTRDLLAHMTVPVLMSH